MLWNWTKRILVKETIYIICYNLASKIFSDTLLEPMVVAQQ